MEDIGFDGEIEAEENGLFQRLNELDQESWWGYPIRAMMSAIRD